MAKVIAAFKGVEDGKVYPKDFVPGDIVKGDLAREALVAKWAVEDENAEIPVQTPASQGPQTNSGDTDPGAGAGAEIVIPENWQNLPWPQLRSLAAKVAPGSTSTKDDAIAAIQSYVDKLAPANPAETPAEQITEQPVVTDTDPNLQPTEGAAGGDQSGGDGATQ